MDARFFVVFSLVSIVIVLAAFFFFDSVFCRDEDEHYCFFVQDLVCVVSDFIQRLQSLIKL